MQISEQTKVKALQEARDALVFTRKVATPEYEGFRNLDYYLVKDRNPSALRMLDDAPGLVGALTDWFLELADECGRASDPTKSSAAERLRSAEAGNLRSAYVVTHRDFPALERDGQITSPVRCALPGCGRRLARGERTAPADPRDAFAGYRR